MENTHQLAGRFREVLLNGRWIANTNFSDQLSQVDWQQATKKTGSLNTIAALTYHINYYIAGLVHFFETGKLEIHDKYSFDMPPIASVADWESLRNTLLENAEKFAACVEQMPDTRLDQVFVDEKYGTYRRNIEAMIEHCYYHLGQVSLIRKLNMEL